MGLVERDLVIAGRRIRLAFAGTAVVDSLTAALRARVEPASGRAEVTLAIFDSVSTGIAPPTFPWGPEDVLARGSVTGWKDDDLGVMIYGDQDHVQSAFLSVSMFAHTQAVGGAWFLDHRELPWWERAAPIRSLLHWATRTPDRLLAHAAAIGLEGSGVLLAGPGGAGKSSTAVLAALAGFDFAGDDYVLVDVAGSPTAYNVFGTGKLRADSLDRWSELARLTRLPDPTPRPEGKAVVDLSVDFPAQVVPHLGLKALIVPSVGECQVPALEVIGKSEALTALAPTTVLQLPPDGGKALRPLAKLVAALPCYRLHLGTDSRAALGLLRELITGEPA